MESRGALGAVPVGPSEALDKVDAFGLAEAAGTRLGMVEVVGGRNFGTRLLTTPRRAAALTSGRGSGWRMVEQDEEASR